VRRSPMRSTGRNHRARRPLAPSPSRFERSRASLDLLQTPTASAPLLPPSCGPFRRHGRCCRCAAPRQYGSALGLLLPWESLCDRAAAQAAPSLRVRLAGPATSRERGARREQDAPMQLQAGRGRVLVRSCRARTTRHQYLRIPMVNARPDALTRL
jgi:hypothetical protein